MSAYDNDPRVRFDPDGTARAEGDRDGDWRVEDDVYGWSASHPTQGRLRDLVNADYPARYDTRDQVLEHLLGPAKTSV